MGDSTQEILEIDDFFSIKHFKWDVKAFNIITGGMGVGKSLCMKLLYFFERTVDVSILTSDIVNRDYYRDTKEIYNHINEKFNKIFNSFNRNDDFYKTSLQYTYTSNGKTFDLTARWDTEQNSIAWHSNYIERKLKEWYSYFERNTAETLTRGQEEIFASISRDFNYTFPIASVFVPAARAITAITNNDFPGDSLLTRFIRVFKKHAIGNIRDVEDGNLMRILKIKEIKLPNSSVIPDEKITIILQDGRTVSPFELSSGQQELLYFLILICLLPHTDFNYDNGSMTVFIEEPSAHLFPQEQKDTIEYIINTFRNMSERSERTCRLFLSTHSPYVLNVINNMLKKSHVMNEITQCTNSELRKSMEEALAAIPFPHLSAADVSAFFIKNDGTSESMMRESSRGAYLFDSKIEEITEQIDRDHHSIKCLLQKLKEHA